MDQFLSDVLKGLQSTPKYLNSKYFYDKKGDELFQQIMATAEYYPTNCEMEIFTSKKKEIADAVLARHSQLQLVELGPGDAVKSIYLIKELFEREALKIYSPIDISGNIIELLQKKMSAQIPGLPVEGLNGEYSDMLKKLNQRSLHHKLVLFLGGNIGNFKSMEMIQFGKKLYESLSKDDLLLIGFDLKKNPQKILNAYNDAAGITRLFNLNLLHRINRELYGDFEVDQFEHYATYDPDSGSCKSFLVSLKKQDVSIGNTMVHFEKDETIFMEISQKYTLQQINEAAEECGFEALDHFFDSKEYFVDVLWRRK